MRDIGRGAAHVEADDALEAGLARRLDRTDDAAGRAGENAVLALEGRGIGQSAVGLHEHEARGLVADLARDLVHIATQDRREVGVDHGGVAARDQLHKRRDVVADRDLGKADFLGDRGEPLLMIGEPIAVHQQDRNRAKACGIGAGHFRARRCLIEFDQNLSLGGHAFGDFDHLRMEQLGELDPAGENPRAILIGDPERVLEAPCGDQERPARPCAPRVRWWRRWCPS